MHHVLRTVAVSLFVLQPLVSSAEAGEVARDRLVALMGEAEYRAAGLHELTAAQRQSLDAWLQRHLGASAEPTPVEHSAAAKEKSLDTNWGFSNPPQAKEEAPQRLVANIVGNFRGWSGKTRFQLDNGQVWEQRRSGHFNYTGDARRVEITSNSWGFFEMRLIDVDRRVGVKRIR